MELGKILTSLELAIRSEARMQPEPLPGDRWLMASCMQKAVRRGEVETATRAAVSLWLQDRQNFWRRLHVTALEDCGIGAIDAVTKTLLATSSSTFRQRVGDLQTGLHLVRLLCESAKSRSADELYLWLERATYHRPMQERLAKADSSFLAACIENIDAPMATRAMALWYICGTSKFQSDLIPQRKGSFEEAATILRCLKNVPAELTESCISVMPRTRWPLMLFVPLLWQKAEEEGNLLQVKSGMAATLRSAEGIPLVALDMFTRTGQTCFRQLQRAVPELQPFTVAQIGISIFYREGGLLDKAIDSPFFDKLRDAGEMADRENVGLAMPEYLRLCELLAHNADVLDHIREEQIHRYFNGAECDKVNVLQGIPTFTHSGDNGGFV